MKWTIGFVFMVVLAWVTVSVEVINAGLRTNEKARVEKLYQAELAPLLDTNLASNRLAVERALAILHERMNVHRAGARLFAEEMSGFGTRLSLIGRYGLDAWDKYRWGIPEPDHVRGYIEMKFRDFVLSDQALRTDLEKVQKQFQEDLEANRKRLLSQMTQPLPASGLLNTLDLSGLPLIADRINKLTAGIPGDNLTAGAIAFVSSWAGAEVTDLIVTPIVARAVAGSGIGSAGGPAGTVIGFGVCMGGGWAVDWWVNRNYQDQLIRQCDQFLDALEQQIVDGAAQEPGLRKSLELAVKQLDELQRQAVERLIREGR